MSTKICLVRHGQTDWNKKLLIQGRIDNPLNETGKESTKHSCEVIKRLNINWDIILSSPLKRAYQTAEIINKYLNLNLEIKIIDNLTERDFGVIEGKKVCEESYALMDKGAQGLETIGELKERALKAILEIKRLFPNKNILITTHSHFIKGLLLSLIDDFNFKYPLKNNSLTILEINNDMINVLQYDVT